MLRTKEQVNKICTACPLAKTANIIGDTFTLLIIRDLLEKPRRFGDIEHSLSGVSSRTITKKLKFLEEKKIIKRTHLTDKPPRVEYSLTKDGKELSKIVESMRSYGKRFL